MLTSQNVLLAMERLAGMPGETSFFPLSWEIVSEAGFPPAPAPMPPKIWRCGYCGNCYVEPTVLRCTQGCGAPLEPAA